MLSAVGFMVPLVFAALGADKPRLLKPKTWLNYEEQEDFSHM